MQEEALRDLEEAFHCIKTQCEGLWSVQAEKGICGENREVRGRISEATSKICQSWLCVEAENQGNRQEEGEVLMHEDGCDLAGVAEAWWEGM